MKTLLRLTFVMALATGGVVPLFAGGASAHSLTGTTISCSTVSGTFQDFAATDHPIVWHVKVGNGSFQTVATTESPSAFVGTGTAKADISAMADALHGVSGTVEAFATWPGQQSATTSQTLVCGTAVSPVTLPPTTSTPPTTAAPTLAAPTTPAPSEVAGVTATRPAAATAVSPATAVAISPRFTG
jgi:hypothetical protein